MKVISLVSCFLFLAGCGGGSSATSVTTEVEETGETATTSVEDIVSISFDENNEAVIQFTDVEEDDRYLIALYSSETNDEVDIAYSVSPSDTSSSFTTQALQSTENNHDFHNTLRNLESQFPEQEPFFNKILSNVKVATVGQTRTFKVLADLTDTRVLTTVTAELRIATDNLLVYVDVRNENALSDQELEEVILPFDDIINFERELFGEESDVNADGLVTVLMTQAVNELGSLSGGIISGYFYGADLYSEEIFESSNEMEIIYTLVPDPTGSFGSAVSKSFSMSNILPSVLPHELQHMINYNQHVFVNEGSSEESFLNEGLSHLAEDIYSIQNGYMESTGVENPSRVSLYLNSTEQTCITCGSNIVQRGGSYLLMRYLYEQAQNGRFSDVTDGADLISNLINTNKTGIENITQATLGSQDEDDFDTLFSDFIMAVYLSQTTLTSDNRYHFEGIDLRAEQGDNRGTTLDGPEIELATGLEGSGVLNASGVTYLYVTGEDILENDSLCQISIDNSASVGGFILKVDSFD